MGMLNPRTAEIVIYQGDDLAVLADLRRRADIAQRRVDAYNASVADGTDRLGDAPTADAEKEAYDTFVDEAAERAVVVKVQAIGRRRFRSLVTAHPPRTVEVTRVDPDTQEQVIERETHPDDERYGVNTETFPVALLNYVDDEDDQYRTILEPDFTTAARRRAFLDDDVSDGDFEELWVTTYLLNRSSGGDPKARRYSTSSLRSTET